MLLTTDLVVRQGADVLGADLARSERWSPFRSYATMHLWRAALAARPGHTAPFGNDSASEGPAVGREIPGVGGGPYSPANRSRRLWGEVGRPKGVTGPCRGAEPGQRCGRGSGSRRWSPSLYVLSRSWSAVRCRPPHPSRASTSADSRATRRCHGWNSSWPASARRRDRRHAGHHGTHVHAEARRGGAVAGHPRHAGRRHRVHARPRPRLAAADRHRGASGADDRRRGAAHGHADGARHGVRGRAQGRRGLVRERDGYRGRRGDRRDRAGRPARAPGGDRLPARRPP